MNDTPITQLRQSAIAAFEADGDELNTVKKNILWYASINMMHGALRPEPPPPLPSTANGPIDPSAAEAEDRRRQLAATKEGPVANDPAALSGLATLTEQGRYDPFNLRQNINNQIQAIAAITGCLPVAATFKQSYINSLNAIQNTSIPCQDALMVSFDNPRLLEELCREGLISRSQPQFYSAAEQQTITGRIGDALAFIKAVDGDLYTAIHAMIGTIACVRREGSSGTVSSMVGLIWINPDASWTVLDFAESIVHEYIHNTIFLADLVRKIFTTPHWYAPEDGLVISAIKKYPRGVNIAFHSVFVAIGLAIFMDKARQHVRAGELTAGLRDTLDGLREKSPRFLSDFGSDMLERVDIHQPLAA